MIAIRRPQPRFINAKGVTPQKEVQARYLINLVANNPQYKLLLASLKSGIGPTQLASHWASQGWITVNERTFAEAIRAYRTKHPELIEAAPTEGLDEHANPSQPYVDTLRAAKQLLKVQQLRLGIAIKNEKDFNLLLDSNTKAFDSTTKLVETIAKMEGRITDGPRGSAPEDATVVEDLGRVKKDQTSRDRMHNLVKQVLEVKG
jgi:hypothetical protein